MKWFLWLSITYSFLCPFAQANTAEPNALEESESIDWNEKNVSFLTERFLKAYMRLFLEFPRAFAPYRLSDDVSMSDAQKLLCAKTWKSLCERKGFKQKFTEIYKNETARYQYANKDKFNSVKKINDHFLSLNKIFQDNVESIRPLFVEFQNKYFNEFETLLNDDSNFENLVVFNIGLSNLREASQSVSNQYAEYFKNSTLIYPERLLQSKSFVQLLEGLYYEVESVDIIEAIRVVTKDLKEHFIEGLNKILSDTPYSPDMSYYEEWISEALEIQHAPKGSMISIPDLEDETVLKLIRRFHSNDALVAHFLLHHRFQEAAWRLRDLDLHVAADELENVIETQLFHPDNVVKIKPLGGGAGTTLAVTFKNKLRCVYKPSGLHLSNPVDFFITSLKNEIAASIIDRWIDLRMVPLTVKKQFGKYEPGSCQYFVEDTIQGRNMFQYSGLKPEKFDTPSGRATKTTDMLFFDKLISNWDRNVDNYILNYEGKIVLIDHGFAFKNIFPSVFPRDWTGLKKILPSERILIRLADIRKDSSEFVEALKPWLSHNDIQVILKTMNHTIHYANTGDEDLYANTGNEEL